MIIYKLLSECDKKLTKNAFTLTEVLLAVAIVGIIAALVLPATITGYQERVFERVAERQVESLNNAISGLVVNENKVKFSDTIMSTEASGSVDDTIGKFIKKYLRVSKYCGAPTGGKSPCFADEYSIYANRDKKVVNVADLQLSGACAQLKNGVSLCLTRQEGGNPVRLVMDVNGPKGPNIIGKDFIEPQFLLFQESTDISSVTADDGIYALDNIPIESIEEKCSGGINDKSTDCCIWRKSKNQITAPTHACCQNSSIKNSTVACVTNVTVRANFYAGDQGSNRSSNRGYLVGSGTQITSPTISGYKLPTNSSLSLKIICSGAYGSPSMSIGTLSQAISSGSGAYYFTGTATGSSCSYSSKPVYWSNGSKRIMVNGVQYELDQY